MLRITKMADYATVIMVYLAKSCGKTLNARDIALHTHLALPTVSKLLKKLMRAGLLSSVRGTAGGYMLKRPALEISLLDIIYALDSTRGLTECSSHSNRCELQQVCHIQANWQLISKAIESTLSSLSLASLATPMLSIVALEPALTAISEVYRG